MSIRLSKHDYETAGTADPIRLWLQRYKKLGIEIPIQASHNRKDPIFFELFIGIDFAVCCWLTESQDRRFVLLCGPHLQ